MKITDEATIQVYYQALLERRSDFVGVFYVGVKTTTIFCIATCRARKPKFENVEFFTTFKDALDFGYRPCKVCCPTENAASAPESVLTAIEWVKQHPKEKITDTMLKSKGLSPTMIRRWFNQHYGLTFQAYQRMLRINQANLELKQKNVTETAFDVGYESLSGFGYAYKKLLGSSPMKQMQQTVLIDRVTTPIGPMFICATDKGICLLEFTDRKMLETELADIQKRFQAVILNGENTHIIQAKQELAAYFEGRRQAFNVALDFAGTEFQKSVWTCLLDIDYGKTTTYGEQANSMNKPRAIRAVASANGMNKISIIVPCHRVIGKNGQLTGYGGGLARKEWLLKHEASFS